MNHIHRIRHLIGVLAASACAWLVLAASPALAATASRPHYGPPVSPAQVPTQIRTVVTGGMSGWQIALIVTGAAVLAAGLAVTADRARARRRTMTAPSL